jgi:hypothetical protein
MLFNDKYLDKEINMKITDIIRSVLDIVDRAEETQQREPQMSVTIAKQAEPDELIRIKQIAGLMDDGNKQYTNSPNEKVADIDAVTVGGTDLNRSKNPSDIRVQHPSAYPGHQHRVGE